MPVGLSVTSSRREDPPVSPSRRWTAPARLVPGVLALAWLAVLVTHLRTPVPSDQLNYLTAAARFPHPVEGTTEMHQVTRFGVVVPVRLMIAVFGYSQAAYAIVPVLATLSLLLGTYALGTVLFARPVGVAGGLIVVAATPVFTDSTDLLPDVLAAGLFTCALALAASTGPASSGSASTGRGADAPGRARFLAVGALLGWSYLAREFVVFMWPVALVLLYRRARLTGLLWAALPVAVIVLAELALCWRLYGDPFARLQAIMGHGQGPSRPDIATTYRDKPRMMYILRLPVTLRTYPEGGLLVTLLGLTLLGGLLRPRRLAVPVAACALLWVPLTLLGGVLDPSAPKLRLQLIRYWFPVFPAFVLGGLGLLWIAAVLLVDRVPVPRRAPDAPPLVRRAVLRVALPAAVVLTLAAISVGVSARSWWRSPDTRAGGGTQMEALRSWMRDHDGAAPRIWADQRTSKVLMVYRQGAWGGRAWSARVRNARPGGEKPRPGDLLLLFDTEDGRVCPQCRASARAMRGDPAWTGPRWRQVYGTPDRVVRVYRLAP
ncbi:hypothetical protein AGRA3207_003694 [Actinomadura graeca]|uniref:Glycosyltransferase RgtA/B/C/D-like domain-containing protein n=1 Tax=Actinomadura graeca TaxID=2750812 RepID=A0ABX8QV57_9ACTN|nr:hypothetical protein [Actinomadura graeca]QXJ22655.1 hypothetical protein AGRA3207_003694 [Actinomadura graeca]